MRALIALVALAAALIPLNSTLVALALPTIADDLETDVSAASWLVSAYLVAMVSFQAPAGKAGDRIGRERALRIGLIGFALASIAAAVAPNLELLVAMRVAQAAAGALLFANGVGLLRALPADRRGRVFGVVAAALSVAPALGLPVGGLLMEAGGWRVVFLLNVPLVVAALVLDRARASLPGAGADPAEARFDTAGALLLALLLAGFAVLLSAAEDVPPAAIAAAAVGLVALLAVWVRIESRHPDPVLQPSFFERGGFSAATAAIGLSNLSMYAVLLSVPLLVADGADLDAGEAGGLLAIFSAATAIASFAGGRAADRVGRQAPALAGLVLLGAGLIPIAIEDADAGAALLAGCLAVSGAGLGLSNPALHASGIEALDGRHAGVAAGVLATGRYIGAIVAASLLALLAAGAAPGSTSYLGDLLLTGVGAAWLAALVALALPAARPNRLTGGDN